MQSSQPTATEWTGESTWRRSSSRRLPIKPAPILPASQHPSVTRQRIESLLEAAERSAAQKRRACNECRQQKLRCELANIDDPSSATICSRCTKLGLQCRIDESFKRTRKRKRSVDFEKEIETLKARLSHYGDPERVTSPADGNGVRSGGISEPAFANVPSPPKGNGVPSDTMFATTFPNGTSHESPEHSFAGTTTRPHEHEVQGRSETVNSVVAFPRPRSLGNVEVSIEEADKLFTAFFRCYHSFLPILDPLRTSHAYYELSPLLFWCVVAVASRRHQSNPTLLSHLAQTVPDLLWKTIRSVPHSVCLVQSLLLVCTWPFPTSSSATDPTYLLAGIMIHSSLQMGLHRPLHQQDFTKYRVKLSAEEVSHRISLWIASNVVAQCVSIGVGLQTPAHLHDWATVFGPPPALSANIPPTLHQMMQIESFRNRVTQAFAMNSTNECMMRATQERLPMYRLFENDLALLEANLGVTDDLINLHLLAARLHFHAFFLLDESGVSGYDERLLKLYLTAASFVEQALDVDQKDQAVLQYCPFYTYQTFVCASFILLKVLKSEYFSVLVEAVSGQQLFNSSISALRKMSVSNNDLPGRLSDVCAYLWNHPNPQIVCGTGPEGLQLKIRSRMSMSIVYDSLWLWRNQFISTSSVAGNPSADTRQSETMDATTPGMFQFDDFHAMPMDDFFFDSWFR